MKLQKEFKNFLIESSIKIIWDQWVDIGLYGNKIGENRFIIDPEALLAFSLFISRYDARLFDGIVDWLNTFGEIINLQRLNNIIRKENFENSDLLGPISEIILNSHNKKKWEKYIKTKTKTDNYEDLFFNVKSYGKNQKIFKKYSYLRGEFKLRNITTQIPIAKEQCLFFKIRFLLGLNIRSDIILYLLIDNYRHPSYIAKNLYYTQKGVQDNLVEMSKSGIISVEKNGRKKDYALNKKLWEEMIELQITQQKWINWVMIFSFIQKVIILISNVDFINSTYDSQAMKLKLFILKNYEKYSGLKLNVLLTHPNKVNPFDYPEVFISAVKKMLKEIGI